MPGGNPHKSSSAHPDHRKPRWESSASSSAAPKSKPSPNPNANPLESKTPVQEPPITKPKPRPQNPSPRLENPMSVSGSRLVYPVPEPPPPAPSYGFHMLERRSMILSDGSVRSYFALPPDYENFKPILQPGFLGPHDFRFERPPFPISPEIMGQDPRLRNPEYWNSWKRKLGEDEREGKEDGLERQRQQLLQYGNANGPGSSVGYSAGRGEETRASKSMRIHEGSVSKLRHNEVDQSALKKAFLHLVKLVFETGNQKKSYLADGKQGPLPCLACNRSSSKKFPDAHSLVMHAYNIESADSVVDHLAFHKALCVLMGWNYLMPPDNSKAYQNLAAHEAEANQEDLIMWPPSVLILNTITGKGKEGRMEGIGNRAMDAILKDLGFTSGKSMSMYSREGHMGIHVVKFSMDESGLKDALRMADYFEREKHGRKAWAQVQSSTYGKEDDESNPNLMKLDPKTGEKKRVFYGHLATVADLDKVTFEVKRKVSIVSRKAYRESK